MHPGAAKYQADLLAIYKKQLNHTLLSRDEEYRLGRRIQSNRGRIAAMQKLVEHNLRLVLPIARIYARSKPMLMDYIQDGNIGLMEAASHYNPSAGCRFSTYAKWWIFSAIQDAMKKTGRTIYLPKEFYEGVQKISKLRRELGLHCDPTPDELRQNHVVLRMQPEKILRVARDTRCSNFSDLISTDKNGRSSEYIPPDCEHFEPEQSAMIAQEIEDVRRRLREFRTTRNDSFDQRDWEILFSRYGISEPLAEEYSYDKIQTQFGIGKERIRKACRTLRLRSEDEQEFAKLAFQYRELHYLSLTVETWNPNFYTPESR